MLIGQLCTLAPNFYGTVIILAAAGIYVSIFGFSNLPSWVISVLMALVATAEVGVRGLRSYLTKDYKVSRMYSVNTVVCNLAGVVVADALLGSLIGVTIWELIVGKALVPHLESISKVLVRLIILAILRFMCGIIMIIIICNYVLYRV
ncbi:MAG: hypothetical protein K0R78_1823 [Pelosinus sp.]|nr:hypothetical protein [Pelosinus sp.]